MTSGGTRNRAHTRNFFQHFLHLVGRPLLLQLALHIAYHAAGDFTLEDVRVHPHNVGEKGVVLRPDLGEIIADASQALSIQTSMKPAKQHLHQALGGVVPRSQAERTDGGVDHIGARSMAFIKLTSVTPVVA